jgi:hypothetical protein
MREEKHNLVQFDRLRQNRSAVHLLEIPRETTVWIERDHCVYSGEHLRQNFPATGESLHKLHDHFPLNGPSIQALHGEIHELLIGFHAFWAAVPAKLCDFSIVVLLPE